MIDFIQKNIHLLTPNHLRLFANYHHISYTEEEIQILYQFILNHYQDLLKGNIECLEIIKSKISFSLYKQLINLYKDNIEKIKKEK